MNSVWHSPVSKVTHCLQILTHHLARAELGILEYVLKVIIQSNSWIIGLWGLGYTPSVLSCVGKNGSDHIEPPLLQICRYLSVAV